MTGQVPWVMGLAVGMVDAVAGGELAHVELAEEDATGLSQAGDYGGVVIGDEIGQKGGAAGGEEALGPELVFDGEGDAVEGAEGTATGYRACSAWRAAAMASSAQTVM